MPRGFLDEARPRDRDGLGTPTGHSFVEISAIVARGITGKARRFDVGTKQLFIPFSQMSQETRELVKAMDAGRAVTLSVTEWFARQEGLI